MKLQGALIGSLRPDAKPCAAARTSIIEAKSGWDHDLSDLLRLSPHRFGPEAYNQGSLDIDFRSTYASSTAGCRRSTLYPRSAQPCNAFPSQPSDPEASRSHSALQLRLTRWCERLGRAVPLVGSQDKGDIKDLMIGQPSSCPRPGQAVVSSLRACSTRRN